MGRHDSATLDRLLGCLISLEDLDGNTHIGTLKRDKHDGGRYRLVEDEYDFVFYKAHIRENSAKPVKGYR